MRRFHLERDEDVTGVSGTGRIAEGVEFTDHSAVLKWLTNVASVVFYPTIDNVTLIHGHGGKTRMIWDDPE